MPSPTTVVVDFMVDALSEVISNVTSSATTIIKNVTTEQPALLDLGYFIFFFFFITSIIPNLHTCIHCFQLFS